MQNVRRRFIEPIGSRRDYVELSSPRYTHQYLIAIKRVAKIMRYSNVFNRDPWIRDPSRVNYPLRAMKENALIRDLIEISAYSQIRQLTLFVDSRRVDPYHSN